MLYNESMERIWIKIKDVLRLELSDLKKEQLSQFCSLSYVACGEGEIKQDGKKFKYGAGDVLFCPAGTAYTKKCKNEESITVYFECENTFTSVKVLSVKRDLGDYFEKLASLYASKSAGYYYKGAVILNAILGFFEADGVCFGNEGTASEIKKLIDDSFTSGDFCINDIAVHFNFSEVYARRIFKDEYGIAPKEYLQNARINYACFLLSLGVFSVGEVAQKSGFNDEKYFSSAFKKEKGVSPSEYKE